MSFSPAGKCRRYSRNAGASSILHWRPRPTSGLAFSGNASPAANSDWRTRSRSPNSVRGPALRVTITKLAIPRRHLADVAASDVARPSAVGWLGLLPEVEDLSTDESDRDYHAKQERPRPRPDTAVERIAEEDRDAEHERQIEGGHDEACHGEAAERHALPSARDEGNEDDAGNPAAERDDPE